MKRTKLIYSFGVLSCLLLYMNCTKANYTIKDYILDQAWEREGKAIEILRSIQTTQYDEQVVSPLLRDAEEMMNDTKKEFSKYSTGDTTMKNLYSNQNEYFIFFMETIKKIKEQKNPSLTNDIAVRLDQLHQERNKAALVIIKDLDINIERTDGFILKYVKSADANSWYGNFTLHINNALAAEPDSMPLLFANAEWLHYRGMLDQAHSTLNHIIDLSGSAIPLSSYIENRLEILDLYTMCGTPGFWTEDKVNEEIDRIILHIKSYWCAMAWLENGYENYELVLVKKLGDKLVKKDFFSEENLEWVQTSWYEQILSGPLGRYAEQFIAEDVDKIMEYIDETVEVEEDESVSLMNSDEVKNFLKDLFSLLGDGDDECKYRLSFSDIYTDPLYVSFQYDGEDDPVSIIIESYFEFANEQIVLTRITKQSAGPGIISDIFMEQEFNDYTDAIIGNDPETIFPYEWPTIEVKDSAGFSGEMDKTAFISYFNDLHTFLENNSCEYVGQSFDVDTSDVLCLHIQYYCSSKDERVNIYCFSKETSEDYYEVFKLEIIRF